MGNTCTGDYIVHAVVVICLFCRRLGSRLLSWMLLTRDRSGHFTRMLPKLWTTTHLSISLVRTTIVVVGYYSDTMFLKGATSFPDW